MTRQILAILIVVAIIAVVVRVAMQSGGAIVNLAAIVTAPSITPTSALQVTAPDGNPLPTALPKTLETAIVATVQAALPHPTPVMRTPQRPVVLPNTGVMEGTDVMQRLPFVAFVTIVSTLTAVGLWLGRNK